MRWNVEHGERGGSSILPDREADSFGLLTPFQIVGSLRMPFFLSIDQNPIRPDTAICGENDGTVTETLGSLDALSGIDFAVHGETFLTCGISLGITTT